MNNLSLEVNFKNQFRKYILGFTSSFLVGVLISTIPFVYKLINNYKIEKLIQEEKQIQITKKEKKCKDENSDFKKFLELGFPDTATQKFNICMKK